MFFRLKCSNAIENYESCSRWNNDLCAGKSRLVSSSVQNFLQTSKNTEANNVQTLATALYMYYCPIVWIIATHYLSFWFRNYLKYIGKKVCNYAHIFASECTNGDLDIKKSRGGHATGPPLAYSLASLGQHVKYIAGPTHDFASSYAPVSGWIPIM